MKVDSVGSVCSGIEAASVAWGRIGWRFSWFSEIADFPSKVLTAKYPETQNLGDMTKIPEKIASGQIPAPDLICGGTPCQAFSLAGWKNGLNDSRGNLTLKFVDIIEANDRIRAKSDQGSTLVFWENVEGVLSDKTNAFGCFISSLAGFDRVIENTKWPNAGIVRGPKRNIAWRVLDAKYFGVPQQRRRLYVLAGGKESYPENILFEIHAGTPTAFPKGDLCFEKDGHKFEVFREYTDCLYSSYGTKWNGNAAAYNGSLFVVQDSRLRRLTPRECERLMGFCDDYTNLPNSKRTNRYQATGNSWAVPVVQWIGERISEYTENRLNLNLESFCLISRVAPFDGGAFVDCGKDYVEDSNGGLLNCSPIPEHPVFGKMRDVVEFNTDEELFISPVGCHGMIRRKRERNLKMNKRLEEVLTSISSQMPFEEIEKISRVQKRGRFSTNTPAHDSGSETPENNDDGQALLF